MTHFIYIFFTPFRNTFQMSSIEGIVAYALNTFIFNLLIKCSYINVNNNGEKMHNKA